MKYVKGSDTSRAAAESIEHELGRLQRLVLDFVSLRLHGATCDEAELALSLKHQTASARFRELAELGVIVDSGERRPTSSGRKAIVWKLRVEHSRQLSLLAGGGTW